MDYKRIWHSIRLALSMSGTKRARYIKKHNLFADIGEKCMLQTRKLPLYPELIKFHNNVRIASNVVFVTHDVVHSVLNVKNETKEFFEKKGCIEIMDNVFVGANSLIMYDVRIGPNVVIGAGSVVTKDLPGDSVYAGVPAKYICSFDELIEKRELYNQFCKSMDSSTHSCFSEYLWDVFESSRVDG